MQAALCLFVLSVVVPCTTQAVHCSIKSAKNSLHLDTSYSESLYTKPASIHSLHHAETPPVANCRAVDMGAEQLSKVQETVVYRTLQPALDPALDAISHSAPYTALVDHLRPQLASSTAAVAP